jgi:hypothetical protein
VLLVGPLLLRPLLLLVIQGFQCECYLGAPLQRLKGLKLVLLVVPFVTSGPLPRDLCQ